jgi:dihydrofolate reductase (trimethoprim resistance protein)
LPSELHTIIRFSRHSTKLTPEGYAVESEAHPGSVQIYPVAALERVA